MHDARPQVIFMIEKVTKLSNLSMRLGPAGIFRSKESDHSKNCINPIEI